MEKIYGADMRYLPLILLAGCAAHFVPNDYTRRPPDDWPQLEQQVLVAKSVAELRERCGPLPEASGKYLACTQLYFPTGLCVINVLVATAADVLEHERDHCLGYDHRGYRRGADAWERYKASGR